MQKTLRAMGVVTLLGAIALAGGGRGATLGLESRQPTRDEGKEFGLGAIAGRWRGRLVTSVEEKGPAALAGLREGDVLVRVGDNDLYSQDDLDDVLRVDVGGREVALVVKRAGTHQEETLTATLGSEPASTEGLVWDFAGPGQLDEALARAKAEGKRVVVGLSGAET